MPLGKRKKARATGPGMLVDGEFGMIQNVGKKEEDGLQKKKAGSPSDRVDDLRGKKKDMVAGGAKFFSGRGEKPVWTVPQTRVLEKRDEMRNAEKRESKEGRRWLKDWLTVRRAKTAPRTHREARGATKWG